MPSRLSRITGRDRSIALSQASGRALSRRHPPLPLGQRLAAATGLALTALVVTAAYAASPVSPVDEGQVGETPTKAPSVRQVALPPAEAIRQFELLPGLRIELAASEPQVIDPVSAAFDHRGRLWVVEMNDYPNGPKEAGQFNGKIKVLTDRDGDGYFETANVFADSLVFPTGVQPFRDGVIATVAGEVVYLADTDGDDRCDLREVWFTGFSKENEQLRANHPTWTIENEIHVASGLRGGEIVSSDPRWAAGEKPLSLATRDFRFSPFGGDWRAVAGNSQFGFFQDDAARNFICSNRNPSTLLLAEAVQVEGNPLLPLAQWRADVMPAAEQSQVFPLVNAWTTSTTHAGQFTAACGTFRYQSDLLAPWLADHFFACEPTGSLVQRYRQTADGIVPTAVRGREGVEFLASRDPWFRPVDLLDGPDGAMYVIDMHRAVIEHPDWMPKELQERGDMRWGDDTGRIYRIVPESPAAAPLKPFDFAAASPVDWVGQLASGNRWARETAGRLIAEAFHPSATNPADADNRGRSAEVANALRELLRAPANSLTVSPDSRSSANAAVRALWLLKSMDRLTPDELSLAFEHPHWSVRLQGLRLLALGPAGNQGPGDALTKLAMDPHPLVRYQWLLEFAPQAGQPLEAFLAHAVRSHPGDSPVDREWIGNALSLTNDAVAATFAAKYLADQARLTEPGNVRVLGPLVKRLGWAGSTEMLAAILESNASDSSLIDELFDHYASGLAVRGTPWNQVAKGLSDAAKAQLTARLDLDRARIADEGIAIEPRLAALRRVGLDRSPETLALCRQLATAKGDELYIESLQLLRHFEAADLGDVLVGRVLELPPRATTATVAAMINNAQWTPALVAALETKKIPWGLIDPTSLGRLERHTDTAIAGRIKQLRAGRTTEDRQALVQRYTSALSGQVDMRAGKAVFVKQCAGCHRLDGEGVAVGPDISDMRTQTPEQILASVLDPNAAIDANFYRYAVLTDDGQLLEGLLEDSNEQAVTLRLQDGLRRTLPREQIEQLRATGVSMMPEGFENQISPEAMRDLVSYIKRWRLMSGEIPLGQK